MRTVLSGPNSKTRTVKNPKSFKVGDSVRWKKDDRWFPWGVGTVIEIDGDTADSDVNVNWTSIGVVTWCVQASLRRASKREVNKVTLDKLRNK